MLQRFPSLALTVLLAVGLLTPSLSAQEAADLTRALVPEGAAGGGSTPIYATGFEAPTFAPGDINGQDGWFGLSPMWDVATANPFNGAQHFRGTSDGSAAGSFAISPTVAAGADDLSSTRATLEIVSSGTTFEYIPQSPTAMLVVTRILFNPDGSIDALVSDGIGGATFDPTGATAPSGPFDIGVEVSASTLMFTLYINDVAVFTDLGFAGEVENVALLSANETSGGTMDMDDFSIEDGPIPVELMAFNATVDRTHVTLAWATASETNNAGFEVQLQDGDAWTALGFVEGRGTTTEAQTYRYAVGALDPGTHVFRLKQIDFDGAVAYHGNLEVAVSTPGTHLLSSAYPNPFNPSAQFTLSVAQEQHVTADLYNALGQRIATLFSGALDANQTRTLTIDGAGLASGLYVVRVSGQTFTDALRVTLLK